MTTFKIAHIHEQGQDMIIVPLNDQFEHTTTNDEKAGFAGHLERCAHAAGLRGHIILLWPVGTGAKFFAPNPSRAFASSLSLHAVHASLNRELHCA